MKITFLGTAGGRIVIMTQIRASGGFVLEMDNELIHIDPGPGALVRAKQYGVNLRKLTGVVVSHAHTDHYTDAEMVIESMAQGAMKKRGVLIGSEFAIKGGDSYRPAVSPYHLKFLDRYEILGPGNKTKIGKIEIEATPTKHGETKALGLVFRGSKTLGYAGDGEYFEGQEKHFEGCDYLVLNVLRPKNVEWPEHMNSNQAVKLIGKVRPSLAVIQHFGMKMLKAKPEREAKWIEKETGVKTIAARDGMTIDLGKGRPEGKGLEKWVK
ncbi:MAG: MBL fold metallo-hydrolase [Candidatus Aenigmarchaeota archaeon]|nr:MBL fold metallo-hydrolase [Candidatus Aenigmarchaeota archaeon]NIP40787.1 MBL fold metallo-hydrolase [Candidatus Aenigmarchaeota archaeon]NIQ17902.1 MBL fold metallo-hydrolase [Candidatus Aenigmarchaeota archaeon]NIS73490.1 MBL fold metallo-hydrolase [Candidatus Aenigmarchaeota archaeon]